MIEFVKGRVTEELAINEAEAVVYATLYSGLSFKIAMGNILILGAALAFIQEQLDKALHILEESVAEIEVRFTQHYLISIIYTTLFFQKEGLKK